MATEIKFLTGETMSAAVTTSISERLERLRILMKAQKLTEDNRTSRLLEKFHSFPVLDERDPDELIFIKRGEK